jgi:heptosyltransferase-2
MHKIKKNLLLLKFLSPREFGMQTELFPSELDRKKADGMLLSFENRPLVAIAPGSIWATKCWLIERYTSLAKELAARGYGIVLIGRKRPGQMPGNRESSSGYSWHRPKPCR